MTGSLAALVLALAPQDAPSSPVGVTAWMRDLVLPGTELEVAPADVETPVVVRIAEAFPHGDAHRYDLAYYGLDPGEFDLRDFLRRKDGGASDDLPPIPVAIRSVLPAGQVRPNPLEPGEPPGFARYSIWLGVGAALWVVGLVAILARGGRPKDEDEGEAARPRTFADQLRPLVEGALAGTLSRGQRAELELSLITFWRRRLALEDTGTARALATLKEHAEAGPLVRALEDWLHRPEPPDDVDVAALLAPYQSVEAARPEPGS